MYDFARPQRPRGIAHDGRGLGHAVDVHAQKPLLADFPFDINDFQPFRTRHPLGGGADLLQIHYRDSSSIAGLHYTPPGPNKKVGSRPLVRSTRFRAKWKYIPPARQKQDTGSPCPPVRSSASSLSGVPAWAGQLRRKCAGRTGPAAEQLVLFL